MTANDTPARRVRRGLLATLAAAVLVATLSAASASPAGAVDADCRGVRLSNSKFFPAFVTRQGVGAVSWRTYLSVGALDRCSHGSLEATVGFYDANIEAKGGQIRIGAVSFQTNRSSQWRPLRLVSGINDSFRYNAGSHLDLFVNERVTNVRVSTHLLFGGSVYAGRHYTCNLVNRTCG